MGGHPNGVDYFQGTIEQIVSFTEFISDSTRNSICSFSTSDPIQGQCEMYRSTGDSCVSPTTTLCISKISRYGWECQKSCYLRLLTGVILLCGVFLIFLISTHVNTFLVRIINLASCPGMSQCNCCIFYTADYVCFVSRLYHLITTPSYSVNAIYVLLWLISSLTWSHTFLFSYSKYKREGFIMLIFRVTLP